MSATRAIFMANGFISIINCNHLSLVGVGGLPISVAYLSLAIGQRYSGKPC